MGLKSIAWGAPTSLADESAQLFALYLSNNTPISFEAMHMSILDRKDPTVRAMVQYLESKLGQQGFTVIDHWSDDPYSIGIARSDDLDVLVYVSTFSQPAGFFYFEREWPTTGDLVYESGGSGTAEGLDDLSIVVRKHLEAKRRDIAAESTGGTHSDG